MFLSKPSHHHVITCPQDHVITSAHKGWQRLVCAVWLGLRWDTLGCLGFRWDILRRGEERQEQSQKTWGHVVESLLGSSDSAGVSASASSESLLKEGLVLSAPKKNQNKKLFWPIHLFVFFYDEMKSTGSDSAIASASSESLLREGLVLSAPKKKQNKKLFWPNHLFVFLWWNEEYWKW